MVQLLVKFLAFPLAASILLQLAPGFSSTIRGGEVSGTIGLIKLPAPDKVGSVPLETTLQKRRSVRHFKDVPISLQSVAQLLWAAQGLTNRQGFRTAPSAGALYPLEIYVVAGNVQGLENGAYLYKPAEHALMCITKGDYLHKLSRAALWQDAISQAPAAFIIAGMQKRTTTKYGERGVRYMYMESGHAAQNICLQAVTLELDSVTIGAFTDHDLARIIDMEKDTTPLYIIPVGKAKQ